MFFGRRVQMFNEPFSAVYTSQRRTPGVFTGGQDTGNGTQIDRLPCRSVNHPMKHPIRRWSQLASRTHFAVRASRSNSPGTRTGHGYRHIHAQCHTQCLNNPVGQSRRPSLNTPARAALLPSRTSFHPARPPAPFLPYPETGCTLRATLPITF